jgi:serine/threonine-protein kinase RsbW
MDVRARSFPSTSDAAVEASAFVLETAEAFGLSEEVTQRLLLVIGEAVANAAHHGNRLDPAKTVRVECGVARDEVRLCVEDEGEGLADGELEQAALPEDEMEMRGRGLFIMKALATRVWTEQGGRRLCLAFASPEEPPA